MKLPRVWHPCLIGVIPILSAFRDNVHEVTAREIVAGLVVTLTATLVVWVLLTLALGDIQKAALAVSAGLVCFFNFGTVDNWLSGGGPGEGWFALYKSVTLLFVLSLVVALAIRALFKKPNLVGPLTVLLNRFSILTVAILLVLIALSPGARLTGEPTVAESTPGRPRPGEGNTDQAGAIVETMPNPPRLPDIYYLILDGYGRSDVLEEIYGYRNEEFLAHLRQKGFVIAGRSTANYCQTPLSLAASLNCRHLAGTNLTTSDLAGAIRDNAVLNTLKRHGYHLVTFGTGCPFTDIPDADVYLSPLAPVRLGTDFNTLLLDKTPLRLYRKVRSTFDAADEYAEQRQLVRYAFDRVGQIAPEYSPKFVFVHVLCPHPPFVFGPDGEDTSPRSRPYFSTDGSLYQAFYGGTADYVQGYRGQCQFASRMAEQAIDAILRNSPEPPIIIVQSDHGPGSRWNCLSADPDQSDLRERMSILNAYYLPGGGDKRLYEDITPVNSFRIVLNHYFGAHLDLLPDTCYFSSLNERFKLVDVTARVRPMSPSPANHGSNR
jgi:hypothetical protein